MAVKKKKKARPKKPEAPPDIREAIPPTAANLKATLAEVEKALEGVPRPAEPQPGELVEAMLHITFAEGVPCGIGQECRRRLLEEYVDRNEFRLTEAFEIERLMGGLEIPKLFERSSRARESIAEVYNDQNAVTLEFLREASVSDSNMFFERMPVLRPVVRHFIMTLLTFEEIIFSDRSTQRLQQRLSFDPKKKEVTEFIGNLRQLIAPYGHLPLAVAAPSTDGQPTLEPVLSAASLVVRLAPPPKGK